MRLRRFCLWILKFFLIFYNFLSLSYNFFRTNYFLELARTPGRVDGLDYEREALPRRHFRRAQEVFLFLILYFPKIFFCFHARALSMQHTQEKKENSRQT